jgi:hypothetical protein
MYAIPIHPLAEESDSSDEEMSEHGIVDPEVIPETPTFLYAGDGPPSPTPFVYSDDEEEVERDEADLRLANAWTSLFTQPEDDGVPFSNPMAEPMEDFEEEEAKKDDEGVQVPLANRWMYAVTEPYVLDLTDDIEIKVEKTE